MKQLLHVILTLAIVALTSLWVTPSMARQKGDIRDQQLAALLREAELKRDANERLALADSALHMARTRHDAYAEVKALAIFMRYEFSHAETLEQLEQYTTPIMRISEQHGFVEEYYSAASNKATYLINHARYDEALHYLNKIIVYATTHQHYYGIGSCHLIIGNIFWKRLRMAEAIYEYQLAIDNYKKANPQGDRGHDYIRIIESYIVMGQFQKVIDTSQQSRPLTHNARFVGAIDGYLAFAYFMLNRNEEFRVAYDNYQKQTNSRPAIQPIVARCLTTMKQIDDKQYDEAEKTLTAMKGIGYWGYVDVAYWERRGNYVKMLNALRRLNTTLYGDSKGSFIASMAFARALIGNRMDTIARQHAAYEQSQLVIQRNQLQLRNNNLEVERYHNAEHLASMAAQTQQMEYRNQLLSSQQVRDSLSRQRLQREAYHQRIKSHYATLIIMIAITLALIALIAVFLRYNNRLKRRIQRANGSLQQIIDELRVTNEKAQEADRMKTRFVQNMNHEIRTPLNSIVGFSQILADTDETLDDEERGRLVQQICDNSDILLTLVNGVLDLTSLESGRYAMKMEEVGVNDLCRMTLEMHQSRVAEGVEMHFNTLLADSLRINTDKTRATQVIGEMLTNAIKNTSQGTITLACSLRMQENCVVISVTDTGYGVPLNRQKWIFQRFTKIDNNQQGAGLGLYICKVIAEKLGGSITIDANYTQGARFIFCLPL